MCRFQTLGSRGDRPQNMYLGTWIPLTSPVAGVSDALGSDVSRQNPGLHGDDIGSNRPPVNLNIRDIQGVHCAL